MQGNQTKFGCIKFPSCNWPIVFFENGQSMYNYFVTQTFLKDKGFVEVTELYPTNLES